MPDQTARRGARIVLSALLLGLLLLALVPLAPGLPDISQDSAWQYALNQAVADRLAFGRDVIFNLGPLGAVYSGQFHPATNGLMLAGATLLAAALAAGLAALARGGRGWLVLLVPLLIAANALRDPAFIATPLLLLALATAIIRPAGQPAHRPRGPLADLALVLLTAACAMLTLIKATFGTEAMPLTALALAALAVAGHRRLAAMLLGVYAAALAGGWLLAGQHLALLPAYLAATPLLIAGYTEGGALDGPASDIVAFLAAALVLLALFARGAIRRGLAASLLLGGGLCFTLFLAFKAGFVRHDAHALIALGSLALLPLVLVRELPARGLGTATAASLLALVYVGGHYPDAWSATKGGHLLAAAARGGWARLADPAALARRFAANLAAIRATEPLPRLDGPADIYSTGQTVLLANGLDWSPRPSLHSVTVFSAEMARANLDHLQGNAGTPPVRHVFLRIEYDDNRLPAIEDGLSWPALLSAFAVRGFDAAHDLARLERVPGAPAAVPEEPPLLQGRFAVGQPVRLPAAPDGLLWATIDIRPTLAGRLVGLLFRPPILRIMLHGADGQDASYRLLSGPARAGFLLSPVVARTRDFLALLLPDAGAARSRPAWFSISGESGTSLLWQDSFVLTLHRLPIAPQPAVRALILSPPTDPPPALTAAADAGPTKDCSLDDVDDRLPGPAPMAVGDHLRLRGWAAISVAPATLADQLYVRLTDPSGRSRVSAVTGREARPDLAAHYGQPALTNAGFDTMIDLAGLSGPAKLSLEALRDGRRWTCPVTQTLLIGGD
jgi:hypothetical protein